MLSEAEIRLIAGIMASIEAGIFGQMVYVRLYELAKSKNNNPLRRFLSV